MVENVNRRSEEHKEQETMVGTHETMVEKASDPLSKCTLLSQFSMLQTNDCIYCIDDMRDDVCHASEKIQPGTKEIMSNNIFFSQLSRSESDRNIFYLAIKMKLDMA